MPRRATSACTTLSALPANGTVVGSDVATFVDESVGGGAITVFDNTGTPVNIQLRWAKVDSADSGGTDKWNLFYQVDSGATGDEVAWRTSASTTPSVPTARCRRQSPMSR